MNNPSIIPFPQRDGNSSASTKRLTPQSLEAEQSTLGALLLEPDRNIVARAVALLQPDDFYRELHKKIYKAILKIFDKGEPIDIVTVANELRKSEQLDDAGGIEYLSALIEACPSSANIETYAKVVSEKSVLRQLLRASDEIAGWAYADTKENIEEVVYRSESRISNISRRIYPSVSTHVKPILMAAYDQIERRFQHKGEATGISTGFTDLDDITSGLQPSELIVLASRPSMGKTALAFNIAHHIALKERQPIVLFSLEMTKEQVVQRLICSEASIKSHDLRRGKVQDSDWHRITNAVNNIYQAPFFIHDKPGMTSHQISSEARRLCGEHGQFGLIVIDYLQLVRSNQRIENRTQEIGEIVREFKTLARELKTPILLLSQLSRMVEQREDKRPMLSDLRDSGTVEEDADVVAFIYRPSYYKRKMLHKDGQPDPNAEPDPDEGLAEVIIGKQRNGPVGTIRLGFQPEYARFTNLARNDYGGGY